MTNLSKNFMQVKIIEKWENGWNFFYFLEKQEMPGMIWKSLKCLEILFFLVNCSNNYQKKILHTVVSKMCCDTGFHIKFILVFTSFCLICLLSFQLLMLRIFFFLKSMSIIVLISTNSSSNERVWCFLPVLIKKNPKMTI